MLERPLASQQDQEMMIQKASSKHGVVGGTVDAPPSLPELWEEWDGMR